MMLHERKGLIKGIQPPQDVSGMPPVPHIFQEIREVIQVEKYQDFSGVPYMSHMAHRKSLIIHQ